MLSNFNLPSVDHLVEGVHYRIIDWNFAEGCPEGEKMVFGVCRKPGEKADDDKDFDSSKKTKQEETAEAEAKKQKSDVKSNKPVMVNGKKMGWAVKNGKPVMVEWGSVAGEKKVGAKQAKGQKPPADKPKTPPVAKEKEKEKETTPPPVVPAARLAMTLANPNANSADRQAAINEIGRRTLGN